MAINLQTEADWLGISNNATTIANAKLAVAVMKLVQKVSGQISKRDSTGFGELLGPVFLRCPRELYRALGWSLRELLECTPEELSEALLLDEGAHEKLAMTEPRQRKGVRRKLRKMEVSPSEQDIDLLDEGADASGKAKSARRDQVVEVMTGDLSHEFILKLIKQPTANSRKLFSAASQLLDDFLSTHKPQSQAEIGNNIDLLRSALDLDESEVRFLELADTVQRAAVDTSVFSFINRPLLLRQALSALCGIDPRKSDTVFNPKGSLQNSGIFERHGGYSTDLGDLLRLTDLGERLLLQPFQNMQELATTVLKPLAPPIATALEWPHLQKDSQLLESALRAALTSKVAGINILFHGVPGTGKTEFSKYLCRQLQCDAYTVVSADQDGNEAKRSDRLGSLQLCQQLAGERGGVVLVLDEAEDIFQSTHGGTFGHWSSQRRVESKGWTNQLLETNKHPVIWISNAISHLDPAYLRRFAYVMEFRTPPRAQRMAIARQHLEHVGVTTAVLQKLSNNPNLTPAMLSSASQFTMLAQAGQADTAQKSAPDIMVQHHITRQIQASGLGTVGIVPEMVTRFDTRYLNIEGKTPAEQVAASLVRNLRGSALFAGPPGTGKTQLAAHIAERANLELLYRTAADINSMWFGQSEQNVARLFEDCDVNHQMILLDEADILLMTRNTGANRPERAVTAEFLRRLEAFKGIFICATNHSDVFDAALMRRFVFRLEFLPLTFDQRCRMFAELALETQLVDVAPDLPSQVAQALQKLDRLTPGDFANVKKRFTALDQIAGTPDWLAELQQEQAAKGDRSNTAMGFLK